MLVLKTLAREAARWTRDALLPSHDGFLDKANICLQDSCQINLKIYHVSYFHVRGGVKLMLRPNYVMDPTEKLCCLRFGCCVGYYHGQDVALVRIVVMAMPIPI